MFMIYADHAATTKISETAKLAMLSAMEVGDVVVAEYDNIYEVFIYLGSGKQIKIVAPFIASTKDQVVKKGLKLNVPYKYTWSCYEGGEKPCGKCGTCIDRARAFELNGIKDPAMEEQKEVESQWQET